MPYEVLTEHTVDSTDDKHCNLVLEMWLQLGVPLSLHWSGLTLLPSLAKYLLGKKSKLFQNHSKSLPLPSLHDDQAYLTEPH